MAKKIGALTIAVATMPFSAEGLSEGKTQKKDWKNSRTLRIQLSSYLTTNFEVAPNLPINKAFMVADES